MSDAGPWNDWRLALGHHIGPLWTAAVCAAAGFALALSAASLLRERPRAKEWGLFALRAAGILACLVVALEPTLELRNVTPVPNRVAVLVDVSRSMQVRPPGGTSRAERAAALVSSARPIFDRWQRDGHRVDLYGFGETLGPATPESLRTAGATSADATRIGEALSDVRARYAGRDLGATVILSDGIDTGRIGNGPVDAETRAAIAALGAPVHAIGIGESELRDLSVSAVLADEFAFVRTPVKIEAVIRQTGLGGREVGVSLFRDGRLLDGKTVRLDGARSEHHVTFDWVPEHPGNFVFRIATPVLGGEALSVNNEQVFTLKVIRDRIRVLHLCGRPSWDERFLRSLLRRDPNVDLVSFFILRTREDAEADTRDMSLIPFPTKEIFAEQLRSFDLVIFQNFNYGPYDVEPYLAGVRDYVQEGGALAMVGGDLSFSRGGYGATALREILPVELDAPAPFVEAADLTADAFKPRLSAEGRSHPLTSLVIDPDANAARWAALPPLEGINRVRRLRAGATALLVHPTQRSSDGKPAPVLALGEAGKGRSLALLTDTAWHWGFVAAGAGDEGRSFQRFWENAIRWLVRDPALTLLRVDLDRVEYKRQQAPTVRVRTLRTDYAPAPGVPVTLALEPAQDEPAAGGSGPAPATPRRFEVTSGPEGEATLDLGALGAGAYKLTARATLESGPVSEERTFIVRPEGRELDDVAYRPQVLREIAALGHGSFRDGGGLEGLTLREPRELRVGSQRSLELWSSPALLLVAVGLLAAEWFLRRRAGFS